MGRAVDFEGSNRMLVAPKGHEGYVAPMHVFHNGHMSVSCWQLTAAELVEVMRTGCVWLAVLYANNQPPVYVGDEASTREVVVDTGAVWKRGEAG